MQNNAGILNHKIEKLYIQQLSNWPLAHSHYNKLKHIKQRSIQFDQFRIDIQHNPARERSTCAKTDQKSIENRTCFLCSQNRPTQQEGLYISKRYILLINPYPIFNRHLTIADESHQPQSIIGRLTDMLDIAKKIDQYTVLYNGPYCGASAPDHFHFQAVQNGKFPVDYETEKFKSDRKRILLSNQQIQIYTITQYLRSVIVFESKNINCINEYFEKALKSLPLNAGENEARINLLANYKNETFRLTLFPRTAQRPDYYFLPEPQRIVVSAASVEMGGVIITPRNEDFLKIDSRILTKIYADTSLDISKTEFNF
jgi:ATP adenylyltransferase/5',5'''-P-1,P-4-tetraphosphate phosphorylase II